MLEPPASLYYTPQVGGHAEHDDLWAGGYRRMTSDDSGGKARISQLRVLLAAAAPEQERQLPGPAHQLLPACMQVREPAALT